MKQLFVWALIASSLLGCQTHDDLEGSQSHFVKCKLHADCSELGPEYLCKKEICRSEAAPALSEDAAVSLGNATNDEQSDAQLAGQPDARAAANPSLLSYVGSWHAEVAPGSEDYDEYMVLTAGDGRTCVSDRKSQSEFSLMVDENGVHMGSYAFGGGDSLEVSADELRLVRRGEQKGVTYVTEYARVRGTLPTWCVEQLSDAPPAAE